MMRTYLARYTLRNGARGVLHVVAASSCAAVVVALDTFGEALRTCGVRPAPFPRPRTTPAAAVQTPAPTQEQP